MTDKNINAAPASWLVVFAAVIIIVAVVVFAPWVFVPQEKPIPTSQLPSGYEVTSECWVEGKESVEISRTFFKGKIGQTAVFPHGKIVGMDISVSPSCYTRFIIHDEAGGEWMTSTFIGFTVDGETEMWDITWTKKLSPGEKAITPTGERIVLVGFDYNPREDKFIPKFRWK